MYQSTLYRFQMSDIVAFAEQDKTTKDLMQQLEAHHPYTCSHSIRVAYYSMRLATRFGYHSSELQILLRSALLHDIGKLRIPAAILDKTTSLSSEEWAMIHIHPMLGALMLEDVNESIDMDVILRHHENLDGSGYPHGDISNQLSLSVRIVRVADSFDAMTSSRGYNKVKNGRQAIAELTKCTGSFDADVVHAFSEDYLTQSLDA